MGLEETVMSEFEVLIVKRFFELLEKALTPRKKRIPTQKSRAAKLKQVEDKKRRGEIKKMRQKPLKP